MSTPAAVQEKKVPPKSSIATDSGRKTGGQIITLIGVEGVGKSTFAKDAGAAFMDIENGTLELDVRRITAPEGGWTWPSVLNMLRTLETDPHDFTAVAVDTTDALESLIWKHICERDEKENIEAYGYGKGYVAALDEWKLYVYAIERLKLRRGLTVFNLAHAQVKLFKNPEGEDFDRYQPALHEKAAGLIKARSDVVLFANFETFARKKDERSKVEKAKGVSTGARVIYTTRTAAYDAKNRHDLPARLPLGWAEFTAAVKANGAATPADLRVLIEQKADAMKAKGADGEKARADALGAIKRAGEDVQKLRQLNNWATAKLEELGQV
jgi:hypothetical protein